MAASKKITLDELKPLIESMVVGPGDVDHNKMWDAVGKVLEGQAKDCFAFSRAPSGLAWSPLRHPRPRGGSRPLLDTGRLRASLVNRGTGHIETKTPTRLEWGTNLESAAVHNYGAIITPKKGKFLAIPASTEAVRAGSPRRFPDAKSRLGWVFGRKGGIAYEKPQKKKSKKSTKGAAKKKAKPWKFLKKLKRLGKKALKASAKIAKLSMRMAKYTKKLVGMKGGTAPYIALVKKIAALRKQIKKAKAAKIKPPKDTKRGANKQMTVINGHTVQIHYYLTKSVTIPAREFIGISDTGSEIIGDIIIDAVINAMIEKALKMRSM